MRHVLLFLLAACSRAATDPADSGGDSLASDTPAADTPTSDTPNTGDPSGIDSGLYAKLNGTRPTTALPAPDFVAINSDETLRDKEALLGHPTVMWFFPFSGTPG
jgi:hypothetical protein